ncbi:MAG TPA: threonine--tRNA ligase [Candidatus Nanoarchaeia archaeon]|nr:threonine--tRNA ligase [Candidatus Nanoarchaeia archaeon]
MKTLFLHSDYIRYRPVKKALKSIKELNEKDKNETIVKDALVVLISVEKRDSDVDKIAGKLIENIKDVASQVKTKNIVLYPYAHLSSSLAIPDVAENVLSKAEKLLKDSKGFNVSKAPFGYYKEFEIKVKGHPLAELSREIESENREEEKDYDPKQLLYEIKQSKLDTSKLKQNDHRIIGQQMELFHMNQSSPGMPYWLPNGVVVYNELIKFWREEHKKLGYQETMTPLMNKNSLYKISGHWEHYKDNMFISDTNEGQYGLKAMNCPNAMVIFGSKSRSYKELPLRLSDTDRLHRYELSGTLSGLLRVRSFQQDDSHNFISEDMIKDEYEQIFRICDKFYSIFNMNYSFRLGTRPEKFMGDKKLWDKAEKVLKEVLKNSGKKFKIEEGDGAFYGPKIDILMKDSLNREWQMGTIQLDMQMPLRFGLKYLDKDGKEKTPIVVHRVIYGSLERFIGVLLEHTNGRLPTWLAPIQVRVLSFTDRNVEYAKKLILKLGEEIPELRIDADFRNTTVQGKVKDAEIMRIPYIIVLGDKEQESKTVAARVKGDRKIKSLKTEDFISGLKKEIAERS